MAVDVTAYVLLEKDTRNQFIGGREVIGIVELDEGHDRPVWQICKAPEKKSYAKTHVPSGPENILLEGVEFLVGSTLGTEIKPSEVLARGLKGYVVHIILFGDSSCASQASSLIDLGIKVSVFRPGDDGNVSA
jgi:hypothetical protein